jgi:tRNA-splicing ligase RtcB
MTTKYRTWGPDLIEQGAKTQMDTAAALPVALAGALMPDAHQGYGLPIGGVLALDNAVCPYAVGVDIACRMKLSIFPFDPEVFDTHHQRLCDILEDDTLFGVGGEYKGNNLHPVIQKDWGVSPVTLDNQAKARRQLGTSGSGNHFVEFGVIDVPATDEQHTIGHTDPRLNGLPMNIHLGDIFAGKYLALMSHSGSRGTGAAVADYYTKIAKALRPEYGDLAWLDLGTFEGDEYWAAMNLMGEYASANHDVIHREIALSLGREPIFQIENHHNFAWKEVHQGREMIVHRKGATPAGAGVLGVIPGSMGTAAYVVRGLGNTESLCSASHGAGRQMSRSGAKKALKAAGRTYRQEIDDLAAKGITVLSAGADELVGSYKDIEAVMDLQSDLVEKVAKFEPRIVKMCGGRERAED